MKSRKKGSRKIRIWVDFVRLEKRRMVEQLWAARKLRSNGKKRENDLVWPRAQCIERDRLGILWERRVIVR